MSQTNLFQILPLGDSAVVVRFGDSIDPVVYRRVRTLTDFLAQHPIADMIEQVPAYATVTIYYDLSRRSYREIQSDLQQILSNLRDPADVAPPKPRIVQIPVCYGEEFGPDLEFVARHNSLTISDAIEIHSNSDYVVYMIGFAPGFPYLGGMSNRITAPRRESPRLRIPAGSVGIAGTQTGVYPLETPGGWQLIGQTPLELFRPQDNPPTLLHAGDTVQFQPITRREFGQMRIAAQ